MRQAVYGNGNVDGTSVDQGLYTIGELAAHRAVSPRAIRFYEEQGLIAPRRAGANRVYDRRDRGRLQLILRGKRLGFTLADIRQFLDLYDDDRTGARQMALTLDRTRARIQELQGQLQDIQLTLAELREIEAQVLAVQGSAAGKRAAKQPSDA